MPPIKSEVSYQDLIPILDRAMVAPKGIRIPFQTKADAVRFRARCNEYRVIDRKRNQHIYPPGDRMHGSSAYDILVFKMEPGTDGAYFITMSPRMPVRLEDIEEIE